MSGDKRGDEESSKRANRGYLSFNREAARRLRITAERVRTKPETRVSHKKDPLWVHDKSLVCDPKTELETRTETLEPLLDELCASRTGEAFVASARAAGYVFVYDAQNSGSQCYTEERIITVNPHLPRAARLTGLIDALHIAWYEKNDLLFNPLTFEPDEAILFNRAKKANMLISKIKIALERRLSGDHVLWNYLKTTPAGGMMGIVQALVSDDFRSLNNGQALCVAYNRYFESDLVKQHDKKLIHTMLLDEGGYVFSGVEPSSHLTDETLIRLGILPFGTNHILALLRECSPSDPEYWVVEDRSNANFLWFIKFERSFQIQENKALHSDVAAEVIEFEQYHTADVEHQEDEDVEQVETADIILLQSNRFGASGEFSTLF